MSFSANYRRVRAPQQPHLRIIVRFAVLFLCILIFYWLFINTTVRTLGRSSWPFGGSRNDESNSAFPLTNYRVALNKSGVTFWMSIHPAFLCPAIHLNKMGLDQPETKTKAKWICGIKNLGRMTVASKEAPPCLVYSFTMESESHFEADILRKTNCTVFLYDSMRYQVGPPLEKSPSTRLHFQKMTLGGEDKAEERTLELLMELNGHRWIDILRIETNTGEYRALERIFSDFQTRPLPFGQLVVKFHVMDWKTPKRSFWMVALFEMLESRGFRLFYNQVNPYAPCCAEMSFINVNHLEKFLSKEEIEGLNN